jgi:hypothetical protein
MLNALKFEQPEFKSLGGKEQCRENKYLPWLNEGTEKRKEENNFYVLLTMVVCIYESVYKRRKGGNI